MTQSRHDPPADRATTVGVRFGAAPALAGLLVMLGLGLSALLIFVNALLRPGALDSVSLPLVAIAAGLAATFNPCALPALPGLLTGLAGTSGGRAPRIRASAGAAVGAMAVIGLLGIVVALAGGGTQDALSPHERWVQLAAGSVLIGLALTHLAGRTSRLPFGGRIMAFGGRLWDRAMAGPVTFRRASAFGAGFVAIGFG